MLENYRILIQTSKSTKYEQNLQTTWELLTFWASIGSWFQLVGTELPCTLLNHSLQTAVFDSFCGSQKELPRNAMYFIQFLHTLLDKHSKHRRFMKVACLKNLKPDRVELARCHLFRCIFLSVKDQGPPWLSSVIKVISKCSCENTRRLNPNDSLALLPLGLVASRFSHPRWIWIYFWKGMQHGGRCCCKKRRWEEWRSQKYGVGHGWVCFFFSP